MREQLDKLRKLNRDFEAAVSQILAAQNENRTSLQLMGTLKVTVN